MEQENMKQKNRKRKKLKFKILKDISVILISSMIVTSLIGYIYFAKVVREQKIADEKQKMHQLAKQLEYMTDDIQNFSRSILMDDNLLKLVTEDKFDSEFDEVKNLNEISSKLTFYNSLRTFIWSSYIEMSDGKSVGSLSGNDSNYVKRQLDSDALQEFKNHKEWIYSNPYQIIDVKKPGTMVCFRQTLMNPYDVKEQKGTLYFEIYLNYFTGKLKEFGNGHEELAMVGLNNNILYNMNSDWDIIKPISDNKSKDNVLRVQNGYIISEKIPKVGWTIYTLISNDFLWDRSSFVLRFFAISFFVSTGLILIMTSNRMTSMIRPVLKLSKMMERTDYKNLYMTERVHSQDEIQTLYECYENMITELREEITQRMEYEKQKKNLEFDIMLSQINPHYLYNVMNTVVYLAAAENNKKVVTIVNSLIYSLQETLKLGENNVETTVEKELELTNCYLEIQKIRYPDMFEVVIDCPEELKQYLIPKTTIQPLVENAILHGILPSDRKGSVLVRIRKGQNRLQVSVIDDGIGISQERIANIGEDRRTVHNRERRHFGISNVRDLIQHLYGSSYGMNILNREDCSGTLIEFTVPLKQ